MNSGNVMNRFMNQLDLTTTPFPQGRDMSLKSVEGFELNEQIMITSTMSVIGLP